jgi:hypothetical protein
MRCHGSRVKVCLKPSDEPPDDRSIRVMKLQFSIVDAPKQMPTQTILELCDFLNANVLEPMLRDEGNAWDRRFMNFFVLDSTCDLLEPTGVMKLTVPGFFAGRTGQLEEAITTKLFQLGIRTGKITYEKNTRRHAPDIMVITVTQNPTVLISPPPVNMTHARGCVVLRDLLGYRQVDGRYVFASEDILKRASALTEDEIAARVASPVKVGEEVKRVSSPIVVRAIGRCLEEIKSFAQWAVTHNYRQLAAA